MTDGMVAGMAGRYWWVVGLWYDGVGLWYDDVGGGAPQFVIDNS